MTRIYKYHALQWEGMVLVLVFQDAWPVYWLGESISVWTIQNNEQILFLRNLGTEIEQISVTSQSKDVQIHSGQMYLRPDEAASVRISKTSQNDFRTELAVVALSESGADLGLASGVKIPVTAKSRSAFVLALPYLLALAVTAGSYFVLKKRN